MKIASVASHGDLVTSAAPRVRSPFLMQPENIMTNIILDAGKIMLQYIYNNDTNSIIYIYVYIYNNDDNNIII
jgi:hypothetical protein